MLRRKKKNIFYLFMKLMKQKKTKTPQTILLAWGAGRRVVFPQCGVGHAWTLGLVLRPVSLSGMLAGRRLGHGVTAAWGAGALRKGS